MINIKELFLNKMLEEIGYAFQHGVRLKTPVTHGLPAKELQNEFNLKLPQSLIDFYTQTSKLTLLWEIFEVDENTKQFKDNIFLKQNYFDKGYDWNVVKDMLTGYINITNSKDIFNTEFCKQQAYYYRLDFTKDLGNKDDFFPFDIQGHLTACLKKNGDTLLDNIWLVHEPSEKIYDMKITIEQYLQLAYESKCIYHWQLVYLFKQKEESYEIMKQFLPKILPHVILDLSKFGI